MAYLAARFGFAAILLFSWRSEGRIKLAKKSFSETERGCPDIGDSDMIGPDVRDGTDHGTAAFIVILRERFRHLKLHRNRKFQASQSVSSRIFHLNLLSLQHASQKPPRKLLTDD
jgi:hypothetical protein